MNRRFLTVLTLTCLLLTAGCSTFDKQWSSLAAPAPTAPKGIAGRWEGQWRSQSDDHHGPVRCIVTPVEQAGAADAGGSMRYRFHFHARWGGGFVAEYSLDMNVRQEGDTLLFSGAQNLGWLSGGEYRCDGSVVNQQFHATYESKYDHGAFEMNRPASGS